MRIVSIMALSGLLLTAVPAWAQATAEADVAAFRRLRAEGVAAANADDPAGAARLLAEADARIPNHPGLMLMRARLAVGAGQPDEAMTQLNRYAGAGLVANLATDRTLSALAGHPDFDALAAVIEANRAPVGAERLTTVAEIPGAVLVESAVRDPARGRWLLSQVRGRTIVALDDAGMVTPFLTPDSGIGGVFGLVLDAENGLLWAATSPLPPATHGHAADAPRPTNALLKIDAATGRVLARYPAPEGERSLGDLALAADGTVYVADSTGGDLFRLTPGGAALEVLLPAGTLGSPQGLVVTPDGTALIVADYSSGLWRVDRETGTATRLPQPAIDSLIGVDGLTTDGRFLYGFQNGVAPQRVLRFRLDAGWNRIDSVEVLAANLPQIDEPTTGMVHDGALVFVSRSQWSDFAQDGAPPATPVPAVISRLPL
jgi:sugar lactone lactonase YvrE